MQAILFCASMHLFLRCSQIIFFTAWRIYDKIGVENRKVFVVY